MPAPADSQRGKSLVGPTGDAIAVVLDFPPGIQRDGTTFAADRWIDGQHMRWFNGRFRKIGGYEASNTTLTGVVRGLDNYWVGGSGYVHSFSQTAIERATITTAGVMSAVTNRTPAGFTNNTNNNWQWGAMYDAASAAASLIAHCTESLADPGSGTSRPIYYGDVSATSVLVTTGKSTDGGCVVLWPYLVYYGSAGEVGWSDANQPSVFTGGDSGSARVTAKKVIRGLPIRGSGTQTNGLLWSLDSLLAMSYVGGAAIFRFQTLSNQISVLSSRGIVEYEGRFYWPAMDRFMMYDGSVRTLPNFQNVNYFYDNVNFTHRQKIWGLAVPRFGEIWWFYPRGAETECSHAVIFNISETMRTGSPVWYDTTLARTAGTTPGDFRFPLMADTTTPLSTIWRHETGVDSISGGSTAINSYVETGPITLQELGLNNWTLLDEVEHDATQVGDVTMGVTGRQYARSSDVNVNYTVTSTTTRTDLLEQRRQMRVRLTSNEVLGNMEQGKTLLHVKPGNRQ